MTESDLLASAVKRHEQKKLESRQKRDLLRTQLPVLTKQEITRCRLNFHEALFIELNEEGFIGTAHFVHDLLEYQDELRTQHGPDSLAWARPQLKDKKKLLEKLCQDLKIAETFHQKGNIPQEAVELLKIAVHYGFNYPDSENPNNDWHWLAEQILVQAIRSSFECTSDGGRADALSNYIYGKFIVEKSCYKLGQAEALSQMGACLILLNDPRAALTAFMKSYRYHFQLNNLVGICDALINIAMAYSKLGKKEEAEREFEKLLDLAEEHDLIYYTGQANRFLGEYHLMQGNPTAATPVLLKALTIFHNLNKHANMEQTRNLASIAQGQELIEKYISLILKCNKKDYASQNLAKLVAWKDRREPFWRDMPSPTASQTMFSYDFSNRRSLIYPPDTYTFEKYCKMHASQEPSDHLLAKVFMDEDKPQENNTDDLIDTYLDEELARIERYCGGYYMAEMTYEYEGNELYSNETDQVSASTFVDSEITSDYSKEHPPKTSPLTPPPSEA